MLWRSLEGRGTVVLTPWPIAEERKQDHDAQGMLFCVTRSRTSELQQGKAKKGSNKASILGQ
jgi:hypothetical protein